MTTLVFHDAPPGPALRSGRRPDRKTVEFAEALRAMPGKWAVLSDVNSGKAAIINNGLSAFGPAGAFQAVCRDYSRPGRCDVWVRFVGQVAP